MSKGSKPLIVIGAILGLASYLLFFYKDIKLQRKRALGALKDLNNLSLLQIQSIHTLLDLLDNQRNGGELCHRIKKQTQLLKQALSIKPENNPELFTKRRKLQAVLHEEITTLLNQIDIDNPSLEEASQSYQDLMDRIMPISDEYLHGAQAYNHDIIMFPGNIIRHVLRLKYLPNI
ncbi:MAG: hypothetical protein ACE365_05835 [Gammaproteobacteria bacterium]